MIEGNAAKSLEDYYKVYKLLRRLFVCSCGEVVTIRFMIEDPANSIREFAVQCEGCSAFGYSNDSLLAALEDQEARAILFSKYTNRTFSWINL